MVVVLHLSLSIGCHFQTYSQIYPRVKDAHINKTLKDFPVDSHVELMVTYDSYDNPKASISRQQKSKPDFQVSTKIIMSVLIAVASSHNSTVEIGERIAEHLRSHVNVPVDVFPAESIPVGRLAHCQAVIVGSAIHMGSWMSPAKYLVDHEKALLAKKAVWAFSVGVPASSKRLVAEEKSIEQSIRVSVPGLKSHKLFMGRVEKDHMPTIARWIFNWLPNAINFGDHRDWDSIDKWANEVSREMKLVL
jgi:menaquinone-dependent protoporphyrinogen oxidase